MQLAKEAYEAYVSHVGGNQPPKWEDLHPKNQRAWECAAAWVVGKTSGQHAWKIPRMDKAFAARFKAELDGDDAEADHKRADALLCELLTSIGCTETVEAFEEVQKWYS